MTDTNSAPLASADGELSPELKAYFDTKGEAPMPGSEPAQPAAAEPAPQPAPESNAAPEAGTTEKAAEPDDDDDASVTHDGKRRRVEWSAYEREKRQRKETEQRLAKMQDEFARMLERQRQQEALMMEKARAPQPEQAAPAKAEEIPDPENDIFGATKFALDKVKQLEAERAAEMARRVEEQRRYDAQRQQVDHNNRLVTAWRQYGAEKQQADPEFWPAYTYMTASRKAELVHLGMDEQSASRQVAMDELAFLQQAAQRRQDPAELIKAMARARIETLERHRAASAPAPAAEPAKAAPSPQRLDTLARAQEANKTLTGVGSPGSARGSIGAADIAKMSHAEMEAFLDKAGDAGFRAAMTR